MKPLTTALRLPLRALPDPVHALVLTRVVNRLLRHQPLGARLSELEGCSICLQIDDTGSRVQLRVQDGRLVPAHGGKPRVTIRGELRAFVALATRAEDPDTLFFQRRLCIEGNVETGLHIKNLLDTLDFDWESQLARLLPAPIARIAIRTARRAQTFAASLGR